MWRHISWKGFIFVLKRRICHIRSSFGYIQLKTHCTIPKYKSIRLVGSFRPAFVEIFLFHISCPNAALPWCRQNEMHCDHLHLWSEQLWVHRIRLRCLARRDWASPIPRHSYGTDNLTGMVHRGLDRIWYGFKFYYFKFLLRLTGFLGLVIHSCAVIILICPFK